MEVVVQRLSVAGQQALRFPGLGPCTNRSGSQNSLWSILFHKPKDVSRAGSGAPSRKVCAEAG